MALLCSPHMNIGKSGNSNCAAAFEGVYADGGELLFVKETALDAAMCAALTENVLLVDAQLEGETALTVTGQIDQGRIAGAEVDHPSLTVISMTVMPDMLRIVLADRAMENILYLDCCDVPEGTLELGSYHPNWYNAFVAFEVEACAPGDGTLALGSGSRTYSREFTILNQHCKETITVGFAYSWMGSATEEAIVPFAASIGVESKSCEWRNTTTDEVMYEFDDSSLEVYGMQFLTAVDKGQYIQRLDWAESTGSPCGEKDTMSVSVNMDLPSLPFGITLTYETTESWPGGSGTRIYSNSANTQVVQAEMSWESCATRLFSAEPRIAGEALGDKVGAMVYTMTNQAYNTSVNHSLKTRWRYYIGSTCMDPNRGTELPVYNSSVQSYNRNLSYRITEAG